VRSDCLTAAGNTRSFSCNETKLGKSSEVYSKSVHLSKQLGIACDVGTRSLACKQDAK
jgi:hypothetical protein